MAASVTAATSVGAAGARGEHLDDLALDECRVDVHDDEPLGPAVQAGRARRRRRRRASAAAAASRGAQLGRVDAGDLELDGGDGIARDAHDAVDVAAVVGDAAGDAGQRRGRSG